MKEKKKMINRRIEVFGRIKPALENTQIKDYVVEDGTNKDDVLKFSPGKCTSGRCSFRFKKIFRPEASTQEDVFENAAKPIIENVLTGYNGTIFAYGQTGTGKTYTMTGDFTVYNERGIIPRTIQFLFHCLKDTSTVTISYFEIYNEHGYDLIGFQPTTNTVELQQVNVLEDSRGNLHFRNLSAHNVRSVQEALDLLLFGDGNRMVAETMNNLRSSRSHTIFLVTLETMDPSSESSIRSTLHLVDLAGSERLGKTGNLLNNSWESRYINLSLHYLEHVLVALGEPGRIHIPYRNSLMTTVLKNSLGGNCCTSMIATFSCDGKDFEETLQTCRFSQRVALVRNEAKINQVTDINKELMLLRRENAFLKDQLRELTSQQSPQMIENCELMENEKNDCYERVKDFIANSQFMNLPLSNSRKAEYCFLLMRNEIMRLKPLKSKSDPQDDHEELTGVISGHPSGSSGNCKCKSNSDGTRNELNLKRNLNNSMRKRRVVMDIPKINVIYKKSKSIDSRDFGSRDVPKESRVTLIESEIPSDCLFGSNAIPQSGQTSKVVFKNKIKTYSSDEVSEIGISEKRNKLKDVEKKELRNEFSREKTFGDDAKRGSTDNFANALKVEFEEEFREALSTEAISGEEGRKRCDSSENMSKVEVEEDVQKKELRNEFSREKTFAEVEKSGIANESKFEVEEEFVDVEDDDEQDVGMIGSEWNRPESGGTSGFSTSGLPLTGDKEIDEEIIEFYRARHGSEIRA